LLGLIDTKPNGNDGLGRKNRAVGNCKESQRFYENMGVKEG
jgi:hypothetical protein